ncbi:MULTISPECIES: hypothetical protein [Wohlfahrtiimonas]|uniref:hypothetical protein n=1 Tax=Wohlfahrtiimonas TaxID=582472 RepID=UPI0007B69ACE|nr:MULTISPECIES: hypothetical protein [Wohlfahrtiimonas]KZX37361.1 hypothetical protein A6V30_00265 [Wohlfahrtiimonas chitiniclastica]OYQ74341.1 hypothetical protein B9T20_03465 [Wohlfahrtiimonas sp. G9077]
MALPWLIGGLIVGGAALAAKAFSNDGDDNDGGDDDDEERRRRRRRAEEQRRAQEKEEQLSSIQSSVKSHGEISSLALQAMLIEMFHVTYNSDRKFQAILEDDGNLRINTVAPLKLEGLDSSTLKNLQRFKMYYNVDVAPSSHLTDIQKELADKQQKLQELQEYHSQLMDKVLNV